MNDLYLKLWIRDASRNRFSNFYKRIPGVIPNSLRNVPDYQYRVITSEELEKRQAEFTKTPQEKLALCNAQLRWKNEQSLLPHNQRSQLYKN